MNIESVAEGILQLRDIGDLGQQPELDLRIVGGDELVLRPCNEGLADLAPFLGPDRNILEIRLG